MMENKILFWHRPRPYLENKQRWGHLISTSCKHFTSLFDPHILCVIISHFNRNLALTLGIITQFYTLPQTAKCWSDGPNYRVFKSLCLSQYYIKYEVERVKSNAAMHDKREGEFITVMSRWLYQLVNIFGLLKDWSMRMEYRYQATVWRNL